MWIIRNEEQSHDLPRRFLAAFTVYSLIKVFINILMLVSMHVCSEILNQCSLLYIAAQAYECFIILGIVLSRYILKIDSDFFTLIGEISYKILKLLATIAIITALISSWGCIKEAEGILTTVLAGLEIIEFFYFGRIVVRYCSRNCLNSERFDTNVQDINEYLTQRVVSSMNSESCIICMRKKYSVLFVKLDCNHQYHFGCVEEWLLRQKNCPLCRSALIFGDRE